MAIDYSNLPFGKKAPGVLVKRAKAKAEDSEWRLVCKAVDARDKRVCQVTGKSLSAGAVDPWIALERHHIQPRSRAKLRKFDANNVLTVSRAVHQLIHGAALLLLNARGYPADDVRSFNHVGWNRNIVCKGEEPCAIRKGLAVRKDTKQ